MKHHRLLLPLLLATSVAAYAQPTHAMRPEGNPTETPRPQEVVYVSLDERSNVRLTIEDSTGHELATVHDGVMEAGPHAIRFDATGLPSHGWFYNLKIEKASPENESVSFSLSERARVHIAIVDAAGRIITTVHEEVLDAGDHTVAFDAAKLPAGEWYYRLITERPDDSAKPDSTR